MSQASLTQDISNQEGFLWGSVPDLDYAQAETYSDNKTVGPEVANDPRFYHTIKPFELEWIFGFNIRIPIINLSTIARKEVFYVSGNTGIFYDYCSKEERFLRGHQNKIVSASADLYGRWLVTAENGSKENLVIVWDTTDGSIIWTIFNKPGPPSNIHRVALSLSAQLLVVVYNNDQNETNVDFWFWTYGNNDPNYSHHFEKNLGHPKAIEFHPNDEHHFMVVFERNVAFFFWDSEQGEFSKPRVPQIALKKIGTFTDGTYVERCHECFASTSKGFVLVFGNTIYSKPYSSKEELDNRKMYVKSIHISRHAINCIESADGIISTADCNGNILFFDNQMLLLYWWSKFITIPILDLSFKLVPPNYKFDVFPGAEDDDKDLLVQYCVDYSREYETIVAENAPTDATLENRVFITRDLIISTKQGSIYAVNVVKNQHSEICLPHDSVIVAIEPHDERPYLVVAFRKGSLVLLNYQTHEALTRSTMPMVEYAEEEETPIISALKFSKEAIHLAVGKSNGEVWLLHPTLLTKTSTEPFKFGSSPIKKIAFTDDSLVMAYYDDNTTVSVVFFDATTKTWVFKGKIRSHYKEIVNIFFTDDQPQALYTVGKDRNIIRYCNFVELNSEKQLDIDFRERIEQKDIPLYLIPYLKNKFNQYGYFLLADDKHKFKVLNAKTAMCTGVFLGPAYGCFEANPVNKMEFLPQHDQRFLIFMCDKQLGIQMVPVDGNPYKYVGIQAHFEELTDFQMSHDGKHVFTIGKNDRALMVWRVRTAGVVALHEFGGVELQPCYCLLEGGRNGPIFQEIRDLFYYMQILQQGEKVVLPRLVTNTINIVELPDLVRACGYYPTEYEIENLLTEAKYKEYDETGLMKDKVTFCDFVKLLINHKPAFGYKIEDLEEAFDTMTTFNDENIPGEIEQSDFVQALTSTGEMVSQDQMYKCLITLMRFDVNSEQPGERDFSFLPATIDFDNFTEEILGIDPESIQREEKEDDSYGGYGYYTN